MSVRGDRGEVRRQARRRGWGMPVGYDHDGAVSNAYAVAICPTITFAGSDGKVASTSFSLLGEQALVEAAGGAAVSEVGAGWVDPEVAAEFPELRLHALTLAARSGRSPEELRERLRRLSDRFRGPQAVVMRQRPVPWAYRVFFRHIGLDPDDHRTPVEALALERLKAGGFRSRSLLDDALTIAVMETGVPVWALDSRSHRGRARPAPGRRAASTSARASTPPTFPVGPAAGGRRRGAGGRAVRRARARPRRRAGDDADDAVLGPGGRACRTSTSTRRCGPSPTS